MTCFVTVAAVYACAQSDELDPESTGIGGGPFGGAGGGGGTQPFPDGGESAMGGIGGAVGGTAGVGPGGTAGVGGATGGSAGAAASSGASQGGGAGMPPDGSVCPSGKKLCGGICIDPAPSVGCSLADCTPCAPAPANGTSKCSGATCDFDCNSGFVKNGAMCDPDTGAGGMAGGGGSGGTSGCTPPAGTGTCDTHPQCGCSSGQNCIVSSSTTGATSCATAGSTGPYNACATQSDCAAGTACVQGNCQEYCEDAGDTCPGQQSVCGQISSGATPVPGFFACTRSCDPTSPTNSSAPYDPCGPNLHCFPGATGVADCFGPAGSATQGGLCENILGPDVGLCAPGYACVLTGGSLFYRCRQFCQVGGGAGCLTGTCTAFSTKQYAGSQEIGFCL